MEKVQSRTQFIFATDFKIKESGTIDWRPVDGQEAHVSEIFKPEYKISTLAKKFKELVESGDVFELSSLIPPSTFVEEMTSDKVKIAHREAYVLSQAIVLESLALLYCVENNPYWRKYLFQDDILRIHENINYVIEILPIGTKYHNILRLLRLMDVDIMYVASRLGGHYGAVY